MVDGRWYLAGITSFGSGCAKPGYPDVYTRLSFYLPWIRNKLKQQWDLGLIALLFVFLNIKSATGTCHCPFLQCLITHVCDYEHKLKIALWMLSLFVCSKPDMHMMQKILSQRYWTVSLGEQCLCLQIEKACCTAWPWWWQCYPVEQWELLTQQRSVGSQSVSVRTVL